MKRIICLHTLTPDQIAKIEQVAPGYTVTVAKSTDISSETVSDAEIIVGWSKHIVESALEANSKLKWIQTWSAGVDTLPLKRLEQRGTLLTNSSGVHAIPIAESIFAMLLSFSRQLHVAVRNQAEGKWEPKLASAGALTLTELRDKTLVIAGVGEIGRETARLAKAFGMKVIGVRRSGKALPDVDQMYTMDGLHEALSHGDYIVSILPLTDETHHLFDSSAFGAVKPGACFINVGRGPTVDTPSLLEALQTGQLGCAGLDVFEEEPLPVDHPLWKMPQVVITPHVAGSTDRYTERVVDIFVQNLQAYVNNQQLPRNLVDYSREY
ncbi:D-2-hydroxyacid dehydrogenase [Paenibacillus pini]|uniref:D-3-phosphoglycerate dehydrogenase n=1 Tax=Paenibacillus pini JCM 16418 TaxID=1236976 RepID=W7YAI0_9BACL|nr:D-2-hydroxyacid dehydrogenase [Paenibacillus pini]GAF08050.1 D-3-phosphoglycerate dehydrogenase [Paenibacillus pini JCM 16418]